MNENTKPFPKRYSTSRKGIMAKQSKELTFEVVYPSPCSPTRWKELHHIVICVYQTGIWCSNCFIENTKFSTTKCNATLNNFRTIVPVQGLCGKANALEYLTITLFRR